jgi:hypothetical protein
MGSPRRESCGRERERDREREYVRGGNYNTGARAGLPTWLISLHQHTTSRLDATPALLPLCGAVGGALEARAHDAWEGAILPRPGAKVPVETVEVLALDVEASLGDHGATARAYQQGRRDGEQQQQQQQQQQKQQKQQKQQQQQQQQQQQLVCVDGGRAEATASAQ